MDTRRISLIALVLLFCVALFTGCIEMNKTALSAETFKTRMEGMSYTVTDCTSQFDSAYVSKVYVATDPTMAFNIEFFEQYSADDAKVSFNKNKTTAEALKGSGSFTTSLSGTNFDKYTQVSNGEYRVVCRVDKTFIFVNTSQANKDAVNTVLDNLGY